MMMGTTTLPMYKRSEWRLPPEIRMSMTSSSRGCPPCIRKGSLAQKTISMMLRMRKLRVEMKQRRIVRWKTTSS